MFMFFDSLMFPMNIDPEHVIAYFPTEASGDWYVSGFHEGAEELQGTPALSLEPVSIGQVVLSPCEVLKHSSCKFIPCLKSDFEI